MLFKNTIRFSPVATKVDMPFDTDLYYHDVLEIPENETKFEDFIKANGIINDNEWWYKQLGRIKNGYTIEDAIEKGGDAIVDGRDAIWNETAHKLEYYNDNFDLKIIIPPETVYMPDVHTFLPKGNVTIPGRLYFYLNFFKMYNDNQESGVKDILPPNFLDLDYLKFGRIRLQELWRKDNTELKARQLGYSKSSAGGILLFNYSFVRASHSVIVAGNDEDADELFTTTTDGLELLKNTQFYKATSINSLTKKKVIAKYYKSRISAFTAGSKNDQVLSRLVPHWVIYEEVGKWAQGLVESVRMFVEPSITTKGRRTGLQTFIGTGGDMDLAAEDMRKMHYSDDSDTFLRFINKFERQSVGKKKSGWFSSKAWFTVVDKDGNSNLKEGALYVLDKINKEKDPLKKHIKLTQWALYAEDSFLMSTTGFFGEYRINLLNKRLNDIRLNSELQIERHGILEWKNTANPLEGVVFIETSEDESFVTIVEEPITDNEGNPYLDLYEEGIDSYDQDESATSTSLGAATIKKKMLDNNTVSNVYIALLLERPKEEYGGKNSFYEHCAMLSVYYNYAMMTIEHTKVLVIDWLINNGFQHLVALKPTLAFANMTNKSLARNKYGVDGSMKPHVMALLYQDLTEENINKMFITKMIIALAKYRYSRNYNCDITVSVAHANIGAKESEMIVPRTYRKEKKKVVYSHYETINGRLVRVSKSI